MFLLLCWIYFTSLCFLIKARPDPDFKYFSKLNEVYLFEKAKYETNRTGNLFFVAGT